MPSSGYDRDLRNTSNAFQTGPNSAVTETKMLQAADYDYIRRLVRERAAIVLDETKNYLIETRLQRLASTERFASVAELVALARRDSAICRRVIEAMTTNETSWMRDVHPFEGLRHHIVPEMLRSRAGTRSLNVWSMACSSGQEPYSIAMVLREYFPQLLPWTLRILATDISTEMIAKAKEGAYSQLEINRGLPASLMTRYFKRDGLQWRVNDDLRTVVEFRPMNLNEMWPTLPRMDIVFLRNVLIYFDIETRRSIFLRLRKVLAPDGYLILGGAETALNLDDQFERVTVGRSVAYRLRSGSL